MLKGLLAGGMLFALISGEALAQETYLTAAAPSATPAAAVQRPVDPGIFDPTRVTAYRPERPVSANAQSVEKSLATPPAAPDVGKAATKTSGGNN